MNFNYQKIDQTILIGYSQFPQILKIEIPPELEPFHPDILALICILAFGTGHPKNKVIFPKPISPVLAQILTEKPFQLQTQTIDPNLKTYGAFKPSHSSNPNSNPNFGIAFGGGHDSLAVMALLDKSGIYAYHASLDQPIRDQPIIGLGHKLLGSKFKVIRSNARNLIRPGWTTWPAVLIPLLVLSNSYHWSHLGLGGNLGSVYLKSGQGYHPSHLKPSLWYRIFQAIGLPLFCPLAGVSDVGVVKILKKYQSGVLLNQAIYCQKRQGQNCHRCPKCYRREIITQRVVNSGSGISNSGPGISNSGPSLLWAMAKSPKDFNLEWVKRYYSTASKFQPPELRGIIDKAIKRYLKPMTVSELKMVEKFK